MEKEKDGSSSSSDPFYKFIAKIYNATINFFISLLQIQRPLIMEKESSYQGYIKQQNGNQPLYSENVEPKIQDFCKCEEKIKEQEHLIGSLKSCIEELKDTILNKNQKINDLLQIIKDT